MSFKNCNKCYTIKPTKDFYSHPQTSDRLQDKCKECQKAMSKEARNRNREKYSKYDQERQKTPERKENKARIQREMRARNPEKYRARSAVGNAIRDKRLFRLSCEVCGDPKSQAHHADYSKPLEVRWLCFKHHRELEHGQTVTAS